MASTSKDHVVDNGEGPIENVATDLEPGACNESILNPTDSFEEFASEISTTLEDRKTALTAKSSTISEIQNEIGESSKESSLRETKSSDNLQSKNVRFLYYTHSSHIL